MFAAGCAVWGVFLVSWGLGVTRIKPQGGAAAGCPLDRMGMVAGIAGRGGDPWEAEESF